MGAFSTQRVNIDRWAQVRSVSDTCSVSGDLVLQLDLSSVNTSL